MALERVPADGCVSVRMSDALARKSKPRECVMSWFKKEERAALDAAVRAVAKPATRLIVERAVPASHEFPLTSTHFGGAPYAEEGDAWPTLGPDNRPYDFLCQINLRDCPEHPDLPYDMIGVFLSWKMIDDGEPDPCVIRPYCSPEPSKAVTLVRPAPLGQDDYQIVPCTIRTERILTYPCPASRRQHPSIVAAASKFWNPNVAYERSLRRLGYREQLVSRVGGFPTWVQSTWLDDEDELVFLAQIDYEPKVNNGIGDAAPTYIAAWTSDPTRFETDCFQSH